VLKTKELKKRYGAKRELFRQFLEAVSRASGSPFSASSDLEPVRSGDVTTVGSERGAGHAANAATPWRT